MFSKETPGSGPQFFHLQTFSRKTNPEGQSIAQVLGEARREPAFSQHISDPKPANLIFGCSLDELEARHSEMIEANKIPVKMKDGSTRYRAIRTDRHTLATAVASYPVPRELIERDPQEKALYERWRQLNIEHLQRLWGANFLSAIEHVDEEYPHIHGYALPLELEVPVVCDARELNPAYAEKRNVLDWEEDAHDPKVVLKLANKAYRAKGAEMQDDYYNYVGAPSGLLRDGPRRKRLSRKEYIEQREQARMASDIIFEQRQRSAGEAHRELSQAQQELEAAKALLAPYRAAMEAMEAFEQAEQLRTQEIDTKAIRREAELEAIQRLSERPHADATVLALYVSEQSQEWDFKPFIVEAGLNVSPEDCWGLREKLSENYEKYSLIEDMVDTVPNSAERLLIIKDALRNFTSTIQEWLDQGMTNLPESNPRSWSKLIVGAGKKIGEVFVALVEEVTARKVAERSSLRSIPEAAKPFAALPKELQSALRATKRKGPDLS